MRQPLVLALLFLAARLMSGEAAVWCVNETVKIKATDEPQANNLVWDGAKKTAALGAARNEYVALQIAVQALQAELKDVTVVPADLKGPKGVLPAANMDLFVEHYLNVTVTSRGDAAHVHAFCTAGEHPTQMVPFGASKFGAPFIAAPKRNQVVWVDIYVPEDAAPGPYEGVFQVKAGQALLSEVRVVLTVWNFILPNETHFRSFLYTGPENLRWGHRLSGDMNTPEWRALEDAYFQMAHQHRLNFHPSASDPVAEISQRYGKYYDGSAFTQRVGRGVGQNVACMSPETGEEAAFKDYCKKIVNLYESRKMTAFLFAYIWDEPHSAEDFAASKQRCKWVREAVGNKLNTYIATPQFQKFDPGDVNVYSEPEIKDIPAILKRGDSVWAVNCGYGAGPYVDSPGFGGRSIVWMNWKMNLGGWQFWDCCYWVDKQNRKHKQGGRWAKDFTYAQVNAAPEKYLEKLWDDPLNFDESRKKGYPLADSIRINGDGLLFYPGYDVGVNGPIASFAMKSLRRGAQDCEYLWLLKQAGRSAASQPIVDRQCPAPGKWNEDVESWDKARLDLAALLDKK